MPTATQRARNAFKEASGLGITASVIAAPVGGAAAAWLNLNAAAGAVLGPAAIVTGVVGYSIYRAITKKQREKYHNKTVHLSELNEKYWSCHIYRVGIVGLKRSGKTEIKTQLRIKQPGEIGTALIETHIFNVDEKSNVFIALIDGMGADAHERQQQFQIAAQADVLVVVLDHNESDKDKEISLLRLNDHVRFLTQLRDHLKEQGDKRRTIRVIFAINKQDLWMQDSGHVEKFRNVIREQEEKWSLAGVSVGEKSIEMSARNLSDIEDLKIEIMEQAKRIGGPEENFFDKELLGEIGGLAELFPSKKESETTPGESKTTPGESKTTPGGMSKAHKTETPYE